MYLKTTHGNCVLPPKIWQHLRLVATENLIMQIFHSFIKYFISMNIYWLSTEWLYFFLMKNKTHLLSLNIYGGEIFSLGYQLWLHHWWSLEETNSTRFIPRFRKHTQVHGVMTYQSNRRDMLKPTVQPLSSVSTAGKFFLTTNHKLRAEFSPKTPE